MSASATAGQLDLEKGNADPGVSNAVVEAFEVMFEASVIHDAIDCEIAYSTLRIEGIIAPALRLCTHRFMYDLPVKIYGGYVVKVEKASYYFHVPPHRYITYMDTPDVLLVVHPGGGARILVCRVDAELCKELHSAEYVYAVVKSIVAGRQEP